MVKTVLEQTIIDTQNQLATMQSLMDSLVSERAYWVTEDQRLRAVNAELVTECKKFADRFEEVAGYIWHQDDQGYYHGEGDVYHNKYAHRYNDAVDRLHSALHKAEEER
jgi:hypothetical protein